MVRGWGVQEKDNGTGWEMALNGRVQSACLGVECIGVRASWDGCVEREGCSYCVHCQRNYKEWEKKERKCGC